MRAIIGFTGLAAASAMATAIVRPPIVNVGTTTLAVTADANSLVGPVHHVTRYVQLQPGQTAPPNTAVQVVPQATPRVVIVTTHQSGVP